MTVSDPKADLHSYLRVAREALLWKLDGLSEYDIRRPMTPTGTNLLGLVKHCAGTELGYFGFVFGRPADEPTPWIDDPDPNADMWATVDESRDDIVNLYRRAGALRRRSPRCRWTRPATCSGGRKRAGIRRCTMSSSM
jgi:hypothetical protein